MKYKYAKTERNGIEFTLVESYGYNDGFELSRLIQKHDPVNKNVLLINKNSSGLTEYSGTDINKLSNFSARENFDSLDWKDSFYE